MNIDEKIIETYTLFRRHVFLLENIFSLKDGVLNSLECAMAEEKLSKFSEVLGVFNLVFSFVDTATRINKIAHVIPKMNQSSREYRAFNSAIGNLTDLRDRFQHINMEVSNQEKDHIMGSISWFSGSSMYMLGFPDLFRPRASTSLPFEVNSQFNLNARHGFSYVLNEEIFDLDRIYIACIELAAFIDSKVTLLDENKVKIDLKEKYSSVRIDFT